MPERDLIHILYNQNFSHSFHCASCYVNASPSLTMASGQLAYCTRHSAPDNVGNINHVNALPPAALTFTEESKDPRNRISEAVD